MITVNVEDDDHSDLSVGVTNPNRAVSPAVLNQALAVESEVSMLRVSPSRTRSA
jgi:hypothetical protein